MKKIKIISVLSVALVLSLVSGLSSAEGTCKGMEKSACTTDSGCRWIKGYERSDGRSVAGYCRKLPGKKVQAGAESQKKAKG